jgi:hypothetical protein
MKDGGADIRVLDRRPANPDDENWRGKIVESARNVAEFATDDNPLAGYAVIGLFADGASSVGWRYDPETAGVPRVLLPHWIAEVIRRDIITYGEARSTFDEMYAWIE